MKVWISQTNSFFDIKKSFFRVIRFYTRDERDNVMVQIVGWMQCEFCLVMCSEMHVLVLRTTREQWKPSLCLSWNIQVNRHEGILKNENNNQYIRTNIPQFLCKFVVINCESIYMLCTGYFSTERLKMFITQCLVEDSQTFRLFSAKIYFRRIHITDDCDQFPCLKNV